MEIRGKIATDIYAVLGSALLGVVAIYGHDKNREKGQKLAVDAVPISHALSSSIQPWIARRLAEKEADIRRQQEMLGKT
jgi:hypothetical protein